MITSDEHHFITAQFKFYHCLLLSHHYANRPTFQALSMLQCNTVPDETYYHYNHYSSNNYDENHYSGDRACNNSNISIFINIYAKNNEIIINTLIYSTTYFSPFCVL